MTPGGLGHGGKTRGRIGCGANGHQVTEGTSLEAWGGARWVKVANDGLKADDRVGLKGEG